MQIRYFAHSWLSDWNHGNAHFLRGLASALVRAQHQVQLYEPMPCPQGGWSLAHLQAEPGGVTAIRQMRAAFPELDVRLFIPPDVSFFPPPPWLAQMPWVCDWTQEFREADIVLVHEWNPPELFAWLLRQRKRFGFRLLLHDTHHRAASDPAWLQRLPLPALDGVIAFGESLRRIYERQGGLRHTYTLHEAADLCRFRPRQLGGAPSVSGRPVPGIEARTPSDQRERPRQKVASHPDHSARGHDRDLIWIGNWGDEERTRELEAFLLYPVASARLRAQVYGVRYPATAQARLHELDIAFGGYLPNLSVPAAYAHAALTVHIPRAPYATTLPGIPTIRMFEALACGMPLISAPWTDAESLFQSGADYWMARSSAEMTALVVQLLTHPEQRTELGRHAAATIAAHHTCAHRARELEAICQDLG